MAQTVTSKTNPRWSRRFAIATVGVAAAGLTLVTPAAADPLWPGGPDVPGVAPLIQPPYTAPAITPASGETVGGTRTIDVNYKDKVADRTAAENGIKITSSADTAGEFEWISDTHVQWKPESNWDRGESVTVEVPGNKTSFKVSDQMTSVGDPNSHRFKVSIGGDVVKDFPASFGKPKHETPKGNFPVILKEKKVVMDSSTYGVPVNSPEGYKLDVWDAVRLTWSGIYVHAAPWSVNQQGSSNVSHGCINLSPENAQWFYNNVRDGDVVTIS